jgi:hypothetical protein
MMYWKARTVRATGLRCLLVLLVWVGVGISGRPAQAAQDSTPPAIPFQPAPAGEALYVSFARPGNVGNIEFDTSDILVYYQKKWLMFFDGSDVGLRGQKLMAFELLADDSILMAFAPRTLTLPEIGQVTHNDVIRFVPRNVGEATRGRFERYLKGLDVGLSIASEAIDALAITPDGRLAVSTDARATIPGATAELTVRGQDIIALTPGSTGNPADGYWEMYVQGADIELSAGSENLNVLWIDPADGSLYLGTRNRFGVTGLSGDGKDILIARPSRPGDFVRWDYMLYLNGASLELKSNLDGLSLAVYPLGPRWFHVPRRR